MGGLSESQVHKFKASTGGVGYSSVGSPPLEFDSR